MFNTRNGLNLMLLFNH